MFRLKLNKTIKTTFICIKTVWIWISMNESILFPKFWFYSQTWVADKKLYLLLKHRGIKDKVCF